MRVFIFFGIFFLLHLYVFRGISTLFKQNYKPQKRLVFVGWLLLFLIAFIGVYLTFKRTFSPGMRVVPVVLFLSLMLGEILYLPFILVDDLRIFFTWVLIKLKLKSSTKEPKTSLENELKTPEDSDDNSNANKIPRSEFLSKAGLIVSSLPLISFTWGAASGAYDYRIRRQKLYLPNLPSAFDGMSIGQISDIHSGSFYNEKAVKHGVEMLLQEKPDVIFFTGDLVNDLATEMKDYQDIFSKVKAELGVFSVLGNHDYGEYYFGPKDSPAKRKNLADIIQTHSLMGWDLLMDEHRLITVDGQTLCVVGVQNWGKGRFLKKGNLKKALEGTEDQPVKLLLSHDPSHWRAQVLDTDVDVMFAGHTHGMQFGIRTKEFQWSPIQYMYKEWAGLYKEMNKQLYVNVGYGFLGYPGRLGILPEITLFELCKGNPPLDLS